MYRMLIPVDSDEDRAKKIAETVIAFPGSNEEIEATILNVYGEFDVTDEGGRIRSTDFYNETDFPNSVNIVESQLTAANLNTTKRRSHGDPAKQILSVAEEINADHILMGGRKRSPAGKVLFGSVTQSVILSAECPVTVITIG